MSRPKSGRTGENVTLYLNSRTLKAARRYAFQHNTSVSDIVSRLLVAELTAEDSIAEQFPRQFKGRLR